LLITSELLMGITAFGGGLALLAGMMDAWLPITWLQHSPFATYRLPALALIVLVGGSNLLAATLLMARSCSGTMASIVAGMSLIVFEIVEAMVIGTRMWLQVFCAVLGLIILLLALWPHAMEPDKR
jgi:hypothetical protein